MYVCMYSSSAHSFDPIVMKLGMDTPWDPRSVMGYIRLRFAALTLRYAARCVIGLRASSAKSFHPIVIKLGMNTPCDPGSVVG